LAGCVTLLGPDLDVSLRAHFQKVINLSEGGAKLTNEITEMIEIAIRSHPGPNQVYVFLFGGNNMRKTTKPILEVAKVVARFRRIMVEAQKAKIRVLLCGTIPDPRPAVDSKLKLFDEALKDLDMGQGNNFLSLRGMMMDAQGQVRKELYKLGDIHLSAAGTQIASLRIRNMLEVMLPTLAVVPQPVPVQAPVQVQPPVVTLPLVAEVNQAPAVQAPIAVLVGQVQDLVIHHVAVTVPKQVDSTAMEVEEEDEILQRLFFKKFGRALPEQPKKSDVDDIDMDLIDLTKDDEEMEEDTTPILVPLPIVAVKAEPIEIADANPDMPEDRSVEQVNTIQSVEAKMEADQRAFEEEFGSIETDNVDEPDEFDDIDIEPLC